MHPPVIHKIQEQTLWLSAQRSIFWEDKRTLIVSDLHFGKTGHFRKSGIPVPQKIYQEDLQRLVSLLNYFQPTKLLVVGDFFHSSANPELQWFRKWREDLAHLQIILVKGNHDILRAEWYMETGIEVVEKELETAPFLFIHDRCIEKPGLYSFCGHLHPGIYLEGTGKQYLRFPCFYFTSDHCILPAFSRFTGMALVEPHGGDLVYAIVEDEVIRVH